ncbi:MAG: sodium:solute symporter family transporter, partial [Gemmatimonadales bacterium]
MSTIDFVVVLVYLTASIGIGVWLSKAKAQTTASDYFLGARNLPTWAILLSIVSTETSALTVISVPGIGARGDLTFLQIALGYLAGRFLVAAWLLPGYFRGDQETAYQRIENRFGRRTRQVASSVFLITRALGDSVRVFATAIPMAIVSGWSIPASILAIG